MTDTAFGDADPDRLAALYDPGLVRNDRMGPAALGEPRVPLRRRRADLAPPPTTTASRAMLGHDGAPLLGTRTLRFMGRNHLPGGAELKAVARPDDLRDPERRHGLRARLLGRARPGGAPRRRQRGRARLGRAGQHGVLGRPAGAHHARSSSPSSCRRARTRCARSCASSSTRRWWTECGPSSSASSARTRCLSAELMLRYKGIEFTRLDLPNMTHKLMLPLLRYRGSTVPVMTIDGKRVSGTMKIARALEAIKPDPPLFPRRRGRRGVGRLRAPGRRAPARPLRRRPRTRRRCRASSPGRCSASRSAHVRKAMPGHAAGRRAARCGRRGHRARPAWRRSPASSTASTRCSSRGRDRRRAPERRRLPGRALGAADAELRPAARVHRRPPRRPPRPHARPRLSRAASGKCSLHSWLPF